MMKKIISLLMMLSVVFQVAYSQETDAPKAAVQAEDMNPADNVTFGVQTTTAGMLLGAHLNGMLSPWEYNVGYQFLGGGLGAGLGIWAGWDRKVPLATTVLTGTGLLLGELEAFLLYSLGTLDGSFTSSGLNSSLFLGGLTGTLLGYWLGENHFPEAGPAMMLSIGTNYSLLTATQLGAFLDWEKGEFKGNLRMFMAGTALAGVGGAVAGYWASGLDHFTPGDVQILGAIFFSGTLAGLGLAVNIPFTQTVDSTFAAFNILRQASAVSLVSSTLSLAGGMALVWGHEFTREQGMMVGLGALGGTLAGAGVAYLSKYGKPGDYLIAQGVGALAVSGAMALYLRSNPQIGAPKAVPGGKAGSENPGMPQVSLHPESLLGAFRGEGNPSPLVTLAWSY